MTNVAAMPIYGKNMNNSSSLDHKADHLENWYAALGTWVLPSCSNDDSGLTLTYFMARSNFVRYAFVWEEGKTMDFSETIVVCDVKVGRCS